jgi:hypothetical protein
MIDTTQLGTGIYAQPLVQILVHDLQHVAVIKRLRRVKYHEIGRAHRAKANDTTEGTGPGYGSPRTMY